MHILNQASMIHQLNLLYVAVGKTGCIYSISRSMRLVRQGDNPNNETLMYILYTQRHHQLSIYKPNCLGMSVVSSC